MSRVTTPRNITPEIQELCCSISEDEPIFVPVVAVEYYGSREPPFRRSLSHLSGKIEPLLRLQSHS